MTEDDVVARPRHTAIHAVTDEADAVLPQDTRAQDTMDTKTEKEEYDIERKLIDSGHMTQVYPNGMTMGVRLARVPSTRGVHLEVVYVLDLRRATFGRASLAMKGVVLERVNRILGFLLQDVDLDTRLELGSVLTPWGRVTFPVIRSEGGTSCSVVHTTKTVYVIHTGVPPAIDLSWLTDSSRIVDADTFSLTRGSEARAFIPEICESIREDKWDVLAEGINRGWWGVLGLMVTVLGALSTLSALIGSGTLLLPLVVMCIGVLVGPLLLIQSRRKIEEFRSILKTEAKALGQVGDHDRIEQSVVESAKTLRIIRDMGFVISPLLVSAARAVESGDTERAAALCASVLDECVRSLSPQVSTEENGSLHGDKGIERFLGIFHGLGGINESQETDLALVYAAITDHYSSPMTAGELARAIGVLTYALYNSGILETETMATIYNTLDLGSFAETLTLLNRELKEPDGSEEIFAELDKKYGGPRGRTESKEEVSSPDEESQDLLHEMGDAGVEPDSGTVGFEVEEDDSKDAAMAPEDVKDTQHSVRETRVSEEVDALETVGSDDMEDDDEELQGEDDSLPEEESSEATFVLVEEPDASEGTVKESEEKCRRKPSE